MTLINQQQHFYNQDYQGMVFDYQEAIKISQKAPKTTYKKYRTLCPGWDNEARRPGKGISFIHSTPSLYKQWLDFLCHDTYEKFQNNERLLFINAWNEWAEGAYLEPDQRFGYAYLEQTWQALNGFYQRLDFFDQEGFPQEKWQTKSNIAVICHLYYFSLWPEIKECLDNIPEHFDLYLNIPKHLSYGHIVHLQQSFPNVILTSFENRGRDILPFIKVLKRIQNARYHLVCKIHSKKSLHRVDGDQWRNHLIKSLLGSTERIQRILTDFHHQPELGLMVARGNHYQYKDWIGSNEQRLQTLAKQMGINLPDNFGFPAGSMFWFKPEALEPILSIINEDDFEDEQGQIDGTLAHAIERLFGLALLKQNMNIKEI